MQFEIRDLEIESSHPDFWKNREKAEASLTRLKRLKQKIEPWEKLLQSMKELRDLCDLAKSEGDSSLEEDIRKALQEHRREYEQLRLLELFSDELDPLSTFLTIHSGAGGTEACDWAQM
ncbi:MAG: PCRF domain-containing protein, partial [Spirochaetales bacterium]